MEIQFNESYWELTIFISDSHGEMDYTELRNFYSEEEIKTAIGKLGYYESVVSIKEVNEYVLVYE